MPNHRENLLAARQLRDIIYRGKLSTITKHADEVEALYMAGVGATHQLCAQAATCFANDLCRQLLTFDGTC